MCLWIGNIESTAAILLTATSWRNRRERIGLVNWSEIMELSLMCIITHIGPIVIVILQWIHHRTSISNTQREYQIIPKEEDDSIICSICIVFFTIFADRPNIVQDATKTTKTCAIEQTNVGGLTSKKKWKIEPSVSTKGI